MLSAFRRVVWLRFPLILLPGHLAAQPPFEVETFLTRYCYDCHGEEKSKGDLTLHDLGRDLISGDQTAIWRLVEEQIEFGDMPPEDAKQPDLGEKEAFLRWIRAGLQEATRRGKGRGQLPEFGNEVDHDLLFRSSPGPVLPGPPRLWRLRQDFYHDLMNRAGDGVNGLSAPMAGRGKPGIRDYAALFTIDEATIDMLYRNAETVVEEQLGQQGSRFAHLTRLLEPGADDGTVRAAIQQQFELVLQRPATDEELNRFREFWKKIAAKGNPGVAARALLVAILMQPEVYYREETGDGPVDHLGRRRLSPEEIARSLSYALGNHYDSGLFRAAAEGRLDGAAGVAEAVRAVLTSPKYDHRRTMDFFREYFGYEAALEVFKDEPANGNYRPRLMVSDLEALIEWILEKDREVFRELLTTDRIFVNWSYHDKERKGMKREKAGTLYDYGQVYGFPPDWEWTDQQPLVSPGLRRGVLMHPAWLAAFSGNFDNDPVKRGKWIRFQLLGGTVPDVPIGVDARIPEHPDLTLRDRLASATSAPECWRCHRKMDPLGLPFEQFDHYSVMRRFEKGRKVDTSGAITRTGVVGLDGPVSDPFVMIDRLARSEHVEQVFVRHVFRFFLGRNETTGDAATLQKVHRAYRESGGSFRALVVALLSSESFLYRQVTPPPKQ